MNIYMMLKNDNRERYAARIIGKWWRRMQVRLEQIKAERWLPLNIDPETANFSDVGRVLKVLDEYALEKLATYEDEPLLPNIVKIQRKIRSYLRTTRLQRAVRDC